MPPLRCASATTCIASVDLPDDSGPKISTMRPRGKPPTPRARSSDNAPVWMASMPIVVFSPILMMDPLPNCLSMAANATSSAFSRSLLTVVLRFLPGSVADVEAGLHDLDCVDGHHTEGVLHGFPSDSPDGRMSVWRCSNDTSVTTNSRSIKYSKRPALLPTVRALRGGARRDRRPTRWCTRTGRSRSASAARHR